MFGKVIYCDKPKIEEYTAIITGELITEIKSIKKSTNKEAVLNLSLLNTGICGTSTYEFATKESILYAVSMFEKSLQERNDFFDFSITDELCLKTIPRGQIVKFNGTIYIPEAFDMIQLIEQFKPIIMNRAMIDMKNDEADAAFSCFCDLNFAECENF